MNHKRPPLPAIILLLIVLAFSIYFIVTQSKDEQNGVLTASGTIEGTQINLSPEMAGMGGRLWFMEISFNSPLLSGEGTG